jgi:hypothetical protein
MSERYDGPAIRLEPEEGGYRVFEDDVDRGVHAFDWPGGVITLDVPLPWGTVKARELSFRRPAFQVAPARGEGES